ncbi:MAG: FeoB small GTPase domain-containing protein, partial [Candidatus Cloacimonadaceae bacterium]|nr:FeoB small GTPase domain-containing protein [Candidatus Cloacimonadaceae bacterium]
MKKHPIIALAGNPNVGKTTLFNALTGSKQRVGNWPGVTVEHKAGSYIHEANQYDVIDLPGIYSLSASSPDEIVARDFILNTSPDLIINIVDAANLERNLYLTIQLMEMQVPMLLVFSMVDIAAQNGIVIEYKHLESHLGHQIVPVVLNKKFDASALKTEISQNLKTPTQSGIIRYDEIVENALS